MEEIIAYHESGHAIAAAISGGQVIRVSIEPDELDRQGDTMVRWPADKLTAKALALVEVRVSLAGPVSEMIYVGDYDALRIQAAHALDWKTATHSISKLATAKAKQLELLRQGASSLYHFFRQDHVWAAVAALADELLAHQTVEQDTVEMIVAQWIGRDYSS